jgi:hypothetical protein
MANPQIPQGVLNRLTAAINYPDFPTLNVTASYLGKEGISITFDGPITTPIETMTGIVQSPEPYQKVSVAIHLLKTQALANAYKTQLEQLSLIGDGTIITDANHNLGAYQLSNMTIFNVNPVKFDGMDAGWIVMMNGIYYVNAGLWNF